MEVRLTYAAYVVANGRIRDVHRDLNTGGKSSPRRPGLADRESALGPLLSDVAGRDCHLWLTLPFLRTAS